MKEQDINSYIWFGTVLRFLQDADTSYGVHGDGRTSKNLKAFIKGLNDLELTITANAAYLEGLPELLSQFEDLPEDAKLTSDQARVLRQKVSAVRKTLTAEAFEKKIFITAPKRWDVDRLLTDPGALFGEGVFASLDQDSALDFGEAGKCIAFERPTAAAFHLMRGTESVLRRYYAFVIRRNRLRKDRQMWGPMLDQMRNKSKPPPKRLLDNLDAIRANFRNPTQHPDETYTLDQVQDLFGLVIPVVNEMVALMSTGQ